jgi:predicted ATPase
MALINPYNNRGMLPVESDMFFGRDNEMQRIENMLAYDSPQCVSIVGERRIGKSSLAYRVFHKLKDAVDTLAVYLDCDRIPGECKSKNNFFQFLDQLVLEALEDKSEIKQILGIKKGKLFQSYSSFEAFIKNTGLKGIKTIIFFDEFEHFPEKNFADDNFFSNLRAAAGNPENRLAFVTLSQSNLKDLTHISIQSSSFWNIFQMEVIGLLDKRNIDRLRRYGFEKMGFSLTGEEMEKIHYYAGDFPFFNQVVCAFLWDSKGFDHELNWDKLEVDILLHYEKLWEDRTVEEKWLLKNLDKNKFIDNLLLKEMCSRGLLLMADSINSPFSGYFSRLIDRDLKIPLEEARQIYINRAKQEPENIDVLRNLKNIYEESGDEDQAKEVEERVSLLKEKKDFEFNLTQRISLHQLELHDLYLFDDFKWTFQPQINLLLGRNGFGKTYLLRLLTAVLQKNKEKTSEFFEYSQDRSDPYTRLILKRGDKTETILRNKILFEESIGKVPVLAVPDMRFVDKSKMSISPSADEKSDLKHYGAYHFLYQVSPEKVIENFLFQLCITYLDKGKRFDLPVFHLIHRIIGELSGSKFEFQRIEPIGRARFQMDVITEGNNKPIPLQLASQGTLSILAIFGIIYEYLKAVFPGIPENELVNQPAIVFIDELDAHLHPAWQQKIVRLLRENFPNVQFIITAHSPFVVAGCLEGEAAVLRKNEKGFTVHVFQQDFIGWEAKELYGKVFQVED